MLINPLPRSHPHFNYFYSNVAVNALANFARWTVSDLNARPIDICALRDTGTIQGASSKNYVGSLVTLPELSTILPDAANCTYYVDYSQDKLLVLDIEKTCPPDIALQLLQLPFLYAEVSKSGRGFHLITPAPDDPILLDILNELPKKVLRTESGDVELLLEHWVTFTRNPVSQERITELMQQAGAATPDERLVHCQSIDTFVRYLLDLYSDNYTERTVLNESAEEILTSAQTKPKYDQVLQQLKDFDPDIDPDDYDNDQSKVDFHTAIKLVNIAFRFAYDAGVHQQWTKNDYIACVYEALNYHLEYRDKHDTTRDGVPYLMYTISNVDTISLL